MTRHTSEPDDAAEPARLDKWLWAARFFKTRALAAEAVDGGKVHLNDERVKRAKSVKLGDEIRLRIGPYEHRVIVRGLSSRRGSATIAATLYEELEESRAAREALAAQRRLESTTFDAGRPSKRDRRQIDEWRKRD